MSAKSNTDAADDSRRKIFIITAIASALLVALLVFWATRPGTSGAAGQQPQLAGALREGTPEFALAREKIVVEPEPDEATESPRPAGDIVMTLRPKVRNFTGRTITGLELLATVVDLDERPVRQRTKIAIPNVETGQAELENNKILVVPILMEGFRKEDVRANIRVVVTGVKFR